MHSPGLRPFKATQWPWLCLTLLKVASLSDLLSYALFKSLSTQKNTIIITCRKSFAFLYLLQQPSRCFFSFTGKLLTLWVLSYDLIRTFNCGKCFIFNFHYFEIFLTQKIYDHFLFLIPLLYLPWSNIDIALYIHPLKSPELSWLKHIYIYVYFNSPNFIYLSKKMTIFR